MPLSKRLPWEMVSRLKVSKSNGLLLRNYPSERDKLIIHGLENSPRFFGSSPTGRTCAHYSAIADNILVTLTSLVQMWTRLQLKQSVLWLTDAWLTGNQLYVYSDKFEQNGMNAVTGLPNRLIRTPTK
ncbi:UNVERIFIED_CONTAM: hypothetical protein NCL1_12051 [Trichonephila clavipes]